MPLRCREGTACFTLLSCACCRRSFPVFRSPCSVWPRRWARRRRGRRRRRRDGLAGGGGGLRAFGPPGRAGLGRSAGGGDLRPGADRAAGADDRRPDRAARRRPLARADRDAQLHLQLQRRDAQRRGGGAGAARHDAGGDSQGAAAACAGGARPDGALSPAACESSAVAALKARWPRVSQISFDRAPASSSSPPPTSPSCTAAARRCRASTRRRACLASTARSKASARRPGAGDQHLGLSRAPCRPPEQR